MRRRCRGCDALYQAGRIRGDQALAHWEYYAATVPQEGKSVLLIVHRGDNKPTGGFGLGKNNYVADFWWVSPKRLLISMERRMGALDAPQLTGNL